jgi:predicted transcriptional regulator
MSEMPGDQESVVDAGIGGISAPGAASGHRAITVDVDRKLDKRLRGLARWQGVSVEQLIAEAIAQYPRVSDQRSVTVQASDAAAGRLAAAAATIGMSEEPLIAEAIDYYSRPCERPGSGPPSACPRCWPRCCWR